MKTATRKMKAELPSAVTTKAVGVSRRVRGALAPERNRQWWQHTPTPSIPALAGWAGSCPCSGWKGALCEAPGPERSRHYDNRTLFRWSAWSLFLRVTKCLSARIQMFSVWLPLLAIVSGLSTHWRGFQVLKLTRQETLHLTGLKPTFRFGSFGERCSEGFRV